MTKGLLFSLILLSTVLSGTLTAISSKLDNGYWPWPAHWSEYLLTVAIATCFLTALFSFSTWLTLRVQHHTLNRILEDLEDQGFIQIPSRKRDDR